MTNRRKQIEGPQVQDLTKQGLTVEEIATFLSCSVSTIYVNFQKELKQGRFLRDSSLRKKQMEMALAGNPTMLIWLGKQLLGQKDQKEISGTLTHEHIDLTSISDTDLGKIASLVESATASTVGSEK